MQAYFKKEYMQYTGSFKERGARYTLVKMEEEQKSVGVIAASAGNHAQALAYHGKQLGIPVTVVMPIVAPIMKVENCKNYGATVIIQGADIGESRTHALKIAKKKGLMYVNGFDHPHILAGQGTMGLEVLDQVPDLDAIVIPIGGGGLIAGCALAMKKMKPDIMVIGVEPERCRSFTNALQHGYPIHTETKPSLADGLTVPTVGCNALATGGPLIDKIVSVSEAWIAVAILRLVELEKAVVEGAGATGLAAILAGLLPELKGKKVVLPLCGGNIDTTMLGRCLERGMAADGRLITFNVTVSDRPGGVAELTRVISNVGVSIKDIVHERAWVKADTFSVGVKMTCETRNRKHSKEVLKLLKEKYDHVEVSGYYETVEEFVTGKVTSDAFQSIDEETPFEGGMNIQYHQDHMKKIEEDDSSEPDIDLTDAKVQEAATKIQSVFKGHQVRKKNRTENKINLSEEEESESGDSGLHDSVVEQKVTRKAHERSSKPTLRVK